MHVGIAHHAHVLVLQIVAVVKIKTRLVDKEHLQENIWNNESGGFSVAENHRSCPSHFRTTTRLGAGRFFLEAASPI